MITNEKIGLHRSSMHGKSSQQVVFSPLSTQQEIGEAVSRQCSNASVKSTSRYSVEFRDINSIKNDLQCRNHNSTNQTNINQYQNEIDEIRERKNKSCEEFENLVNKMENSYKLMQCCDPDQLEELDEMHQKIYNEFEEKFGKGDGSEINLDKLTHSELMRVCGLVRMFEKKLADLKRRNNYN